MPIFEYLSDSVISKSVGKMFGSAIFPKVASDC